MLKETCKKVCKQIWQTTKKNVLLAVVIGVVVVAVAGLSIYAVYFRDGGVKSVSSQVAGQKAIDFINENYLKDTGSAELKTAVDFSGMYKITFDLALTGQAPQTDQILYITKDGRYLFPELQGIPIDLDLTADGSPTASGGDTDQVASCDAVQKTDKAIIEAFVVSNCPYGVQMQKVFEKLVADEASSKENVQIKYIGNIVNGKITAMHGDAEAQENLRQICLREETNKFWQYLSCYMQAGKTTECLASTGVDVANLNGCMTDANRGIKYAQVDFDRANQFGVQGSPTLFINGSKVDEFSFGGRTEDAVKSIICCGSNAQPSFCSKTLSKDSAATSFSTTYSAGANNNAAGGCE